VRWLLRFLVSEDDRRSIEADLAELYQVKRRHHGALAADRWLRRQQFFYPWHLLMDRLRASVSGGTLMQHLWRDLRYSVRSLARVPALSVTLVLTIGVGLGATTAMISVVRAVLVNALPYADAGSLFWIYTDTPPFRFRFSVVDYRALEADHPAFSAIAGYQTNQVTVSGEGAAERVAVRAVTGSYFPLLGQTAHIGRLFDPSDDARRERSVVLTYGYWIQRYGGDPSVLGRSMTIDGASYTIVGVLQRAVGPFEHNTPLFTVAHWPAPTRKGPFLTTALGRLRPDISRAAALETLRATNARLFPIWRSSYQDEKATWGMQDLKARVVGDVGSILLVVLGAVACVLLIACANAVNLLVARALNRNRELAIRGALGASRGRLVQHLLAETATLGAAAALVGYGVAAGSIALITKYGGDYIPRIAEVGLGGPELEWLGILTVMSVLLIGLVPAIHSARLKISGALAAGGRSASDAPATRRLRRVLVAAEFALATPLIVAAVLVTASLNRLNHVEVGISTERVLTAGVSLPAGRYPESDDRQAFWKRALEQVRALPGVEAAALADSRPPQDSGNLNNFDLEDRPALPGQNQPVCTWVGVSPEFFRTVGLRLERGRLLDERALQDNAVVSVVVDRAWANRFFPGEEVIGRRFHEGGCTTCPWTTVVGVVGNVKWTGLDAAEDGTVYFLLGDSPTAYFVMRTAAAPSSLSGTLRQTVAALDPQLALTDVATGRDLMDEALSKPRYLSVLIGMFALTALVLSIVGVYGVMAYFVQQHAREIGIRLALGGDPFQVRRMVVLHGLQFVAIGVAAGIGAALLASRLLTTLLFGITATDLRAIVGVPASLMAVAVIACLVPAHRAARVDPAQILRES
jgi:putative ABC transport system permease protein